MNWFNQGTYETLLYGARLSAIENAYAPYSKLHVGAGALILNEKGHHQYFYGVNIESAVPALEICAERCAIYKGVSSGYRKLYVLALSGNSQVCGLCLQVASEFAIKETIIVVDKVGIY